MRNESDKYTVGRIKEKFTEIWGYEDFRPPQQEIVQTLLNGKDALVILPTGGGKSICFQLPALLQSGLTLVISPLVALMENQVNRLRQLDLSGALLHSELSRSDRNHTLQAISQQKLSLLYLSPETLLSTALWEIISQPQINITGIMIDEAHCLTQWGTTFRPAYRRLGAVRRSLLKHKPSKTKIAIAAFTATADPMTQKQIVKILELKQPKILVANPYRSNLSLKLRTIWTPRGRKQQTLKFIREQNHSSGLIYVRSRKDSQALAQWFKSLGYPVAAYHAGLSDVQRRKIERDWIANKIQFVICTSAFGMGIDKPDCRFVIHYHAPELIAEYVQEVGRAGRDGKPGNTLTLISEPTGWLNPEDKQRSQFFNRQLERQYRTARQLLEQLPNRGEVATIKKQFPQGEMALGILHSLDSISWENPFVYRKHSAKTAANNPIQNQKYYRRQMQQYLKTKQCRWRYLLQTFGFDREAQKFKCGKCDNCQK